MDYLKLNINAIAVNEHKQSIFPWKAYQKEKISIDEYNRQMSDHRTKGVAIICGAVSENLEVIDVDTKYET